MATNGQASPNSDPPLLDLKAFFEHPAFKAATDTQRKLAEKVMGQMTTQWQQATGSVSPDVLRDLSTEWQQALKRMMSAWGEQTAPLAKQTAERAASRAKTLAGVATGIAQAWQTLAKDTMSGADASEAMARFNETVRAQVEASTTATMEMASDIQTVAQRFFDEMQAVVPGTPWSAMTVPFESMSGWAQDEGIEAGEVPVAALFEQMVGTFDRSLGRLLNSPGLGLTREFDEDLARAIAAYQTYLREQAQYHMLMGGLFTKSVERFTRTLGQKAQDGEPVDSLRALTRLWTTEADAVFTDAFRTPDYIEQQNRLVAATMRYRKERRAIAEIFQELNDQPTRTEVDEAFKLLHGARKEIKALRREMAALKAQLAEPGRTQKTTTPPKASAKKAAGSDDLTTINGIGAVRAKKLQEAGYATFADLAAAKPADLAALIGSRLFDEERLADVIADAKALAP